MKPTRAALAPLLLAMTLAGPALAAPHRVITVDRDTMSSGLIGVTALKRQTLSPGIAAFGTVIDPAPAIRARTTILANESAERLAVEALKRTRHLYRAAQNVSESALEQTEAQASEAKARLDGVKATTIARFGATLGHDIIDGTGAWRRIATGDALISVVHPGQSLAATPRTAQGRIPGGKELTLRAIGPAGRVPQGLVGQTYYFIGPGQPIGATLDVTIAGGHPRAGYAVPVSALIYRGDTAYAFAETGKRRFVEITIPLTWPIRGDRAVAAYFVPATHLPAAGTYTGMIVTRGAGLVRSVAAGGHGPAPGTDHD